MQKYLQHLTLSSNAKTISTAADVSSDARLKTLIWLQSAIDAGDQVPVPVGLGGYTAKVILQNGALVVTVYQQADVIVTFAVAPKSKHRGVFKALVDAGMANADQEPETPFCAVVTHPALLLHTDSIAWLFDFELCCAWAWILK